MRIQVTLTPDKSKTIHDSIRKSIDAYVAVGLNLVAKLAYNIASYPGNDSLNQGLRLLLSVPKIKNKLIGYVSADDYAALRDGLTVAIVRDTQGCVTLNTDGVSVNGILKKNLPVVLDAVKKADKDNIARNILDILQDDAALILTHALSSLSEEKTEAIVRLLVRKYQSALCEALTTLLRKKKCDFVIREIAVG